MAGTIGVAAAAVYVTGAGEMYSVKAGAAITGAGEMYSV
jgi:hypothetical protein